VEVVYGYHPLCYCHYDTPWLRRRERRGVEEGEWREGEWGEGERWGVIEVRRSDNEGGKAREVGRTDWGSG
jgi:hypothetical protein